MRLRRVTDHPEAALTLAARGIAAQSPSPFVEPTREFDPRLSAQMALSRHLKGEASSGWIAFDDTGEGQAYVCAMLEVVDEDHPGYTYMPPRHAYVTASTWYAATAYAAEECLPLIVERIAEDARELGIHHLIVGTRAHDWVGGAIWRQIGLKPSSIMAGRRSAPALTASIGVPIRTIQTGDEDSLYALALEEHLYHAVHTTSGTLFPQAEEPNRRVIQSWLANQVAGTSSTYVALEPKTGELLGSTALSIQDLPENSPGRRYLPSTYGYIGLTSVTETARGRGIGRALTARALVDFDERGIEHVFLHYIEDNHLSRPFWNRMGFSPIAVALAGDVL